MSENQEWKSIRNWPSDSKEGSSTGLKKHQRGQYFTDGIKQVRLEKCWQLKLNRPTIAKIRGGGVLNIQDGWFGYASLGHTGCYVMGYYSIFQQTLCGSSQRNLFQRNAAEKTFLISEIPKTSPDSRFNWTQWVVNFGCLSLCRGPPKFEVAEAVFEIERKNLLYPLHLPTFQILFGPVHHGQEGTFETV